MKIALISFLVLIMEAMLVKAIFEELGALKRRQNKLKFKALCEYHVYDYEPENYVDFLVTSEKYSLSNAICEAEKVFPAFKEKMKEKLFIELYKKNKK